MKTLSKVETLENGSFTILIWTTKTSLRSENTGVTTNYAKPIKHTHKAAKCSKNTYLMISVFHYLVWTVEKGVKVSVTTQILISVFETKHEGFRNCISVKGALNSPRIRIGFPLCLKTKRSETVSDCKEHIATLYSIFFKTEIFEKENQLFIAASTLRMRTVLLLDE